MQHVKQQKPRQFEYVPRFYDPNKDDDGKHHVKFRRVRRSNVVPKSSPLRLLIAALILAFTVIYLSRSAKVQTEKAQTITVEEIIIVD